MEKKKFHLGKWLKRKYRLVLYLSESLEARWTFRFNRLGIIILQLSLIAVLFFGFWLLISNTSLRERMPGYPDATVKKHMYSNKVRIDSLEEELRIRDQYLEAIRNILLGIDSVDNTFLFASHASASDSIPKTLSEGKGGIWVNHSFKLNLAPKAMLAVYPPIKGMVSNAFDPARNHYGTDVVAHSDNTIKAALQGTVILANYTVETGYTIVLQHESGIITVYRHAESIMVKTGDIVGSGQAIAVMGNTGEFSTGNHLHFEIWIDGKAMNPENYTQF